MVDLKSQYELIKSEVDSAIQEVIDTKAFIKIPQVKTYNNALATYTGSIHVITSGNGTDGLQLAMMALGF